MVEPLHQCDQGIFKHMVQLIRTKYGGSFEKRLKRRMKIIKTNFSVGGLTLPKIGIWTSGTGIQAHEYRSLMQVTLNFINSCSDVSNTH